MLAVAVNPGDGIVPVLQCLSTEVDARSPIVTNWPLFLKILESEFPLARTRLPRFVVDLSNCCRFVVDMLMSVTFSTFGCYGFVI